MLIYSALATFNAVRWRLKNTEGGQGLVEYALILVLVAIVALVIPATLGGTIANGLYRNGVCVIGNALANNPNACG